MKVKEVTIAVNKKVADSNYGSVGISIAKVIELEEKDDVDFIIALEKEQLYSECDKFLADKNAK